MVPRADALRDLEQEVGTLVRRVRRVIGVRAAQVHPELHPMTYLMLSHVAAHGPLRSSSLACELDLDKGAVSRQVGALVDLGLVERQPDPADGRATLVAASGDGVRRLERMRAERQDRFDRRLGDFSDAELGEFVRLLRRYNAAFEAPAPERA